MFMRVRRWRVDTLGQRRGVIVLSGRRTRCRLQCSTPDGLPGSRKQGSLDQEKPILHRLSRKKEEERRALFYTRERRNTSADGVGSPRK